MRISKGAPVFDALLPNVATRPSGSSNASEWYVRPTVDCAASSHFMVSGWKICAEYRYRKSERSFARYVSLLPPLWRTVRSGRITALTYCLDSLIGGPETNVG